MIAEGNTRKKTCYFVRDINLLTSRSRLRCYGLRPSMRAALSVLLYTSIIDEVSQNKLTFCGCLEIFPGFLLVL